MRIKGNVRWLFYQLIVIVNALLLAFYTVGHQKRSDLGDDLNGGVAIYFNGDKPKELIAYLVGAFIVFIFFLLNILSRKTIGNIWNMRQLSRGSDSLRLDLNNAVHYFHLIFLPVLAVLFAENLRIKVFVQVYILLYAFFLIWGPVLFDNIKSFIPDNRIKSIMLSIIMIMMVGQIAYVFSDHIFGQPKIINEFLNIPEYVVVDGKYVNQMEYFKEHFIKADSVAVVDKMNNAQSSEVELSDNKLERKAVGRFNGDEKKSVANQSVSMFGTEGIYGIGLVNSKYQHNSDKDAARLDINERKFISNSRYEIHWQVLDRYMFHHHGFILNPIAQLESGTAISKLNAQYGIGNIIIFRSLMKMMGGISYENWLKLNALFYVIYFAIYGLVLVLVFGKNSFSFTLFMLAILMHNTHNYEFLILAPGDSPWRNFFDISIFYTLYRYQNNADVKNIFAALVMGVMSVFVNPQIGIMILLALVVSLMIYVYLKESYSVGFILSVFMSVMVSAYLFVKLSSESDLAGYYLKGVIGFPITIRAMVLIFVFIISGYVVLVIDYMKKRNSHNLLLLYLFFYAQGLMVYYVWHADMNGLLARSHIYILVIALFGIHLFEKSWRESVWKLAVFGSIVVLSAVGYVNSTVRILKEKSKYDKIFTTHKVYDWDFDRAKIKSTTDPSYFSETISLINKYGHPDKRIYMISKYDNIIPFLAFKLNAMPFHDLKWYNMTDKEFRKSIDLIKSESPEYLYVDTDINKDLVEDIIPEATTRYGYLYDESVWRAERLDLLAGIFNGVADNYRLVESGRLISVYKKI